MRILSLDLATRTGFAHTDGTVGAKQFDWAGKPNGYRWIEFYNWLINMLGMHDTEVIAYEASVFQKGHAGHVANALVACLEIACVRHTKRHLRMKGYAVSTIKKHATGSGRATKEDMLAAAQKRGMDLKDHDALDALFLLDLALHDSELAHAEGGE